MTHPCYADGCDAQVEDNKLMCRTHWFQVPHELRERVNITYRAIARKSREDLTLEQVREYQDAINAARMSLP